MGAKNSGRYDEQAHAPRQVVGLIAGAGKLPALVAHGMTSAGSRVVCVTFAQRVDPQLRELCDVVQQVGVLRVGRWIRVLRRFGACEAVMVGSVDKARLMHDPLRLLRQVPDLTSALLWYRRIRKDRRSPAVLAALAHTLADGGVTLIDSTSHITEHLVTTGVLTRTHPTRQQRSDIDFAWPLFQEVLRLGIGQSMAVREGDIIAIEAAEGTDGMIARAGELCRKTGWTFFKGASPDHDRRADVPTVGVETIRNLHAAGCRCAALAAHDVILVDRDAVLMEADRRKVAIVGVARDG